MRHRHNSIEIEERERERLRHNSTEIEERERERQRHNSTEIEERDRQADRHTHTDTQGQKGRKRGRDRNRDRECITKIGGDDFKEANYTAKRRTKRRTGKGILKVVMGMDGNSESRERGFKQQRNVHDHKAPE